MPIIGQMTEAQVQLMLAKKDEERERAERRRAVAAERRETRELMERYTGSKEGLTAAPFTSLNEVATRLMALQKEATRKGLTRRRTDGTQRWISREEQAEAIATADQLQKRGF